ncbi:MAG: radical SAM protein [Chordicoccus sp.]
MKNSYLGKLFQTDGQMYFFDAGTNKVFTCNQSEGELIESVLKGTRTVSEICEENTQIKELVEKEYILKCPVHREFEIPDFAEYQELVKRSASQAILELTGECNLRCGYCIYQDHHPDYRGFTHNNMAEEVALRSINHILEDFTDNEFALTFYGGEPLYNFPLMRKCIDHVLNIRPDIKLGISFTTNLTLMTDEMIEYFSNLSVDSLDIMCSLDGPQELHDRFRKYQNGGGTYQDATNAFKKLLAKVYAPKDRRTISINCVIAPPYNGEKLEEVKHYFYEKLGVPEDMSIHYSYLDKGEMPIGLDGRISDGSTQIPSCSDNTIPIENWAVDEILKGRKEKALFDMVAKPLWFIASRPKADTHSVLKMTPLQGSCVPGKRRIYITYDGEFKTCERIGLSPSIGNFKEGFAFRNAYQVFYSEYIRSLQKRCDQCWARTLCVMCYEEMMEEHGLSPNIDALCESSRAYTEDLLKLYYRFIKYDRDYLELMLKQYKFG